MSVIHIGGVRGMVIWKGAVQANRGLQLCVTLCFENIKSQSFKILTFIEIEGAFFPTRINEDLP